MERIDDTGFGGIRVIQERGTGYGVDAVLLAAFAAGGTGAKGIASSHKAVPVIADLGTGCGAVAFILHHKLGRAKITGFDVSAAAVDRALRACGLNGLTEDINFECTDINEICMPEAFDAVVTNPPYFRRTPGEPGAADPDDRYKARHETTADITDFASAASAMLRRGGDLYMVHRPDRLADIFTGLRCAGIEPKEMQLVMPVHGAAANIVLIHGIKGAGPGLKLLPGIAVRTDDGSYTEEIQMLYERES